MKAIIFLILPGLALAQAPTSTVLPEQIKACISMPRDAERLACFDRAVAMIESGASDIPALSAENMFGANPGISQGEAAKSAVKREELRQISGSVASLSHTDDGMMVLTLDNGQVWRQQDNDVALTIFSGDPVTIVRASLGTFRITDKRGRSARFKRVR